MVYSCCKVNHYSCKFITIAGKKLGNRVKIDDNYPEGGL